MVVQVYCWVWYYLFKKILVMFCCSYFYPEPFYFLYLCGKQACAFKALQEVRRYSNASHPTNYCEHLLPPTSTMICHYEDISNCHKRMSQELASICDLLSCTEIILVASVIPILKMMWDSWYRHLFESSKITIRCDKAIVTLMN